MQLTTQKNPRNNVGNEFSLFFNWFHVNLYYFMYFVPNSSTDFLKQPLPHSWKYFIFKALLSIEFRARLLLENNKIIKKNIFCGGNGLQRHLHTRASRFCCWLLYIQLNIGISIPAGILLCTGKRMWRRCLVSFWPPSSEFMFFVNWSYCQFHLNKYIC